LGFFLLMSTALTGCATFKPPQIGYDDEQPAVLQGEPPKPVHVVEIPKPLPLPGRRTGVRRPSRAISFSE
jgi:type IV secretion system protein TrbG